MLRHGIVWRVMLAREANLDGLVGPTHNYAGLSYGNVASTAHEGQVSNPKAAALEGLEKARRVHDLGVLQVILPPHERPHVGVLRHLGFSGDDAAILRKAQAEAPILLAAACSASAMWTANAATVSPSADTEDGRVHVTPANLISKLHRAIETDQTAQILRAILADTNGFTHHAPLIATDALADEGAANHTRFCAGFGDPGVELFVFGRSALDTDMRRPAVFPARQTLEASAAVARRHRIRPERCVFAQQAPHAVDGGVFHNDVISVGHQNVFLCHEEAFVDTPGVIHRLKESFARATQQDLIAVVAKNEELSIRDAVASYLFNSQLLTKPNGQMVVFAPEEARTSARAHAFLERVIADETNPVDEVHYLNLRQSMQNGGGPACLRLRVVLSEAEERGLCTGAVFTDALHRRLVHWVSTHYRDRLHPRDLADPSLLDESRRALDELTQILSIGSIYGFQQGPQAPGRARGL